MSPFSLWDNFNETLDVSPDLSPAEALQRVTRREVPPDD